MALGTYSDLQTSIANWLHRADLSSVIPDFISLCEADFNARLRLSNMETRTTTTLSDDYLALPTGFRELRRMQLNTNPATVLRYITGPEGIEGTSIARVIQPGDVLMIDWGVQLMNFGTDVKRVAYVLKPGESVPPNSIQSAFDKALAVRDVLKKVVKPGLRADDTMKKMDAALRAAGAREVHRTNIQPAFFTHIMGTMRMGSDPATSVVDSGGEAHEALEGAARFRARWETDGRWTAWERFVAEGGRTLTESRLVARARREGTE